MDIQKIRFRKVSVFMAKDSVTIFHNHTVLTTLDAVLFEEAVKDIILGHIDVNTSTVNLDILEQV
jgi:hypothetical protein